jgi:predicted 3-demethylubiquinone-9 3-methyltransferase (glyoxalase superfamily)
MKSITPCLWFTDDVEEVYEYYAGIFPDARLGRLLRDASGTVIAGDFVLAGHTFQAIYGGAQEFPFSEAVSFAVECDGQDEVDHYWSALTANGGTESQCGWLRDKYGLSWQIIPTEFFTLLGDPDPQRVARVTAVMLTQRKLELEPLRAAWAGATAG